MTFLFSNELSLLALKGEIAEGTREYVTRETAYKELVDATGEDFGMDVEKWEIYLKDNNLLRPSHRDGTSLKHPIANKFKKKKNDV